MKKFKQEITYGNYKMNKLKEIKIDSILWSTPAGSVNLLDFNPGKLSIKKVTDANDELEHNYYIKYDKDPFYLVINDLKGYFKYSKEKDKIELEFIIKNQRQAKIYNQTWNENKTTY